MNKIDRREALTKLGLGTAGLVMLTDQVGTLAHYSGGELPGTMRAVGDDSVEAIFFHYGRIRMPNPTVAANKGEERAKLEKALDYEYARLKADWLHVYDKQVANNGLRETTLDGKTVWDHDHWTIVEGGKFPAFGLAKHG